MAARGRTKPGRTKPAGKSAKEQRYEIVMGAINESVYDWDLVRGRFWTSESMERLLGLSPEKLTLAGWQKRIHPEDYARFREATVAHLRGETARFECDYRFRGGDGTWRWARTHGLAVRDKRGRALRMIGSTGDITALKRAEQRYVLATSAVAEGIYEWDVATGALFLTDRAKTFFSISDEQLTPAAWSKRVHPDDFPGYREALIAHLKGRSEHLEHEYRIADGSGDYHWVLDRGIGVRDIGGRVIKVVGALTDITQRKLVAETLSAMSRLETDVQPVLDTIARNAVQLCGGGFGALFRLQDGMLHLAATHNFTPAARAALQKKFPMLPDRSQLAGRAILTCAVQRTEDVLRDPEYDQAVARGAGWRKGLSVPLLHERGPLGVIAVSWTEPGAIPDRLVEVLKTLADQAVIAIENVRLFNETREALEQQRASGEVLHAISSSIADTAPVFDKILESCQRLFAGTIVGLTLARDDGMLDLGAYHGAHREEFEQTFPVALSVDSATTRSIVEKRVIHYPDVQAAEVPARTRNGCALIGVRSAIFAPLLWRERGLGSIFVGRDHVSSFSEKEIALLRIFADQAAIAIENVRLFKQLQVASRHKSEFLANMSHELRTPLNAIIGFARIVQRKSREQLEPQQVENLEKILTSGQHLLALINSILDLSKIEAGRMEVRAAEVGLAPVLEQCVRTVEPLVNGDAVALLKEFSPDLPRMVVDEEKLRQIVINLLSNAVKFTDRGTVRLQAKAANGSVAIAVSDTGIGIAPDKLDLIFEEFEQADASSTRAHGGTGLGLAIARRLARLMGGEIIAESTLGSGSRFTLTLPLRFGA